MRFEGNFSADPNGIESFVNKEDFGRQGIVIDTEKNSIDHIYLNPLNNTDGCRFQLIGPSPPELYFRMDNAHKDRYNLTSVVLVGSC